ECQPRHTSTYLFREYSDRRQWRIERSCLRVIETQDADIVRDSQAHFMNRFVSANRRRVITGEERRHRLAAFQDGLRCKVTDVPSFTGIKVVQPRLQSGAFHRAPVPFVSSPEPR